MRAIAPLARSRSFALRHAVLQLSRPGSQMRIVLLAVGLGSFFIIGVRSLQENLVDQFAVRMTADSPDMFLLDVQQRSGDGGRADDRWRTCDPGVTAPPLVPVLRARVVGVAGPRGQSRKLRGRPRPRLAGPRIHRSPIAPTLESQRARRRRARCGIRRRPTSRKCRSSSSSASRSRSTSATRCASTCWAATIAAKVTSVRFVEWSDSRAGGFMFLFRPGVLEQAPHSFIGFLRGPQDLRPRARGCRRRWSAVAPNVSVIDGREIIDAIKSVVDNVTLAVTVVGTLVRAQRPADPDRRRRDDEVPPRLRGRDLQDARRHATADRDGAAARVRACSGMLAGGIGAGRRDRL